MDDDEGITRVTLTEKPSKGRLLLICFMTCIKPSVFIEHRGERLDGKNIYEKDTNKFQC